MQNVESLQKQTKFLQQKKIEMAEILSGTAFGQVFSIQSSIPKPKQKIQKYGIMKKQRITAITLSEEHDGVFYSSQKNIYHGCDSDKTENTIFSNKYQKEGIIGIQAHQQSILAALSNGSLISLDYKSNESENESLWQSKQILAAKLEVNQNKKYNRMVYDGQNSLCLVGKEVLPFLFDLQTCIVKWNGKNVPNDELDLRVPINDVDAIFFKNRSSLACAHAHSKVRVYDVRTNRMKPSADYHLKLDKVYVKSQLTRIAVNQQNENQFYVSNDLGAVYECDIRREMGTTGKFKQINSTVTDILVNDGSLYVSSLDSYVRVYNLESKVLQQKYYMNKPIYSLNIRCKDAGEDDNEFKEEVLSDAEEEVEVPDADAKKMKKLRKRNKVNLKYLKPVNWDEVPIKEELLEQAKEQYEEINSKDADSYLDEQNQYPVKNQHDSEEEKDSDLD